MCLMLNFISVGNILWILYVLVILSVIIVLIQDKRDPVMSLAWISVISLLPFVGVFCYFIFGQNYRKEKIFNRKEIRDYKQFEKLSKAQLKVLSKHQHLLRDDISNHKEIITLMLNNSKSILTLNNRIKILNNGSETFPSIIEALNKATKFIHLEYYIFENDSLGKQIAKILMHKAKEGVEVRMIYDDVGSWSLSQTFISRMRHSGVQINCFMPVVFPWLTSKVNYRNHRKIVVVDGEVAFTGGINIAERYLKGTKRGGWRDTHLKLEGEAVNLLQQIFVTDWFFVSKKQLADYDKYFPKSKITEQTAVQIATSGPDSDWASIMQAFFAAINKAQKHIYISSPYFLPNQAVLTALKVAALSGIDVKLMLPSRSDSKVVYWATRSYIEELLEAGIKVYFYTQGFNHSKIIMIDGIFSSVGTANMDMRSFEDNFEVSALIYNKAITEQLESHFLSDINSSISLETAKWASRSKLHSIYESLSRLLSPLM